MPVSRLDLRPRRPTPQCARHMGPSFDTPQHALPEIHVRDSRGPDLRVLRRRTRPDSRRRARALAASLRRYGWANARVAHRATYSVDANWKLATENYQECYHCAPAHPEFSRHHATEKPDDEVAELRAAGGRARRGSAGHRNPRPGSRLAGRGTRRARRWSTAPRRDLPRVGDRQRGWQPVAPLMGDFTGLRRRLQLCRRRPRELLPRLSGPRPDVSLHSRADPRRPTWRSSGWSGRTRAKASTTTASASPGSVARHQRRRQAHHRSEPAGRELALLRARSLRAHGGADALLRGVVSGSDRHPAAE